MTSIPKLIMPPNLQFKVECICSKHSSWGTKCKASLLQSRTFGWHICSWHRRLRWHLSPSLLAPSHLLHVSKYYAKDNGSCWRSLLVLAFNVINHLIPFSLLLLSIPFLHFHAIPWIVNSTIWQSLDPLIWRHSLGKMAGCLNNKRIRREPCSGCQEAWMLPFAPGHADYLPRSGWELVLSFPKWEVGTPPMDSKFPFFYRFI